MNKLLLIAFIPALAFANDVLPDSEFWAKLIELIGGAKGATISALVIGFTQLLMVFFKTSLSDFAGKWKIVVVSALSVALSIAGGLGAGMSLLQVLLQGATLAAIQVFIHEFYKHWTQK